MNKLTSQTIALPIYYGFKTLTHPNILENSSKTKVRALIKELLIYSSEVDMGAPQHKYMFIFQMLRQKFPTSQIKEEFQEIFPNQLKIEFAENATTDARFVAEIPVALAVTESLPNIDRLFLSF